MAQKYGKNLHISKFCRTFAAEIGNDTEDYEETIL